MDIHKLEKLLLKEENPKLDFKEEFNIKTDGQKKELTKDVIAIANSKGGRGYLIFGIEDKTKKVIGIIPSQISEESIQQIINNRCYPPISINVDILKYDGKDIAILTIYKSELKPHQMIQNGAFYLRRGSTTDVACREEIATMLQENGLFSYERVILNKLSLEQLDKNRIKKYFNYDYMLLEALGIIGEESEVYHPTIGGLLLFGKNPYTYLAHIYIKVSTYDDIKLFTGNIFKMLEDVEEYIKMICNNENYTLDGLFEAISNAVIHRDYLDISRGITVDISSKNIVVTNPGSLVSGDKLYKSHKIENPKRRNPWLYQRALMIDRKGRFTKYGLGVNRIKDFYGSVNSKVKFINIDSKNLFKVVLPSFMN